MVRSGAGVFACELSDRIAAIAQVAGIVWQITRRILRSRLEAAARKQLIVQLQEALARVKTLRGLLVVVGVLLPWAAFLGAVAAATLAVIEEQPHKEVAAALGISVVAVKLRVFRALRLLRTDLERQSITP